MNTEIVNVCEFAVELNEDTIANQIKKGNKILNYRIFVYPNEGPIPHFHVKDVTNGDKGKDVCICIFSANYFSHGVHNDTLNKQELKVLDSFLRSQISESVTYWHQIVLIWDKCNPTNAKKYPSYRPKKVEDFKQPDYTNISTFVSNPVYY